MSRLHLVRYVVTVGALISVSVFGMGSGCPPPIPTPGGDPSPGSDGNPPAGSGSEPNPVLLGAVSSAQESWSSATAPGKGEIEPFESVHLVTSLLTDPGAPVTYQWKIRSMAAADSTPQGELWDLSNNRRFPPQHLDKIGFDATYRAGIASKPEPDDIIVEVYKTVNDEKVFFGSASVQVQVKICATRAQSRLICTPELSEALTNVGDDWTFNCYANFNWPSQGEVEGYRVEVHTPGQQEFLDWFYLGNPPSYAPRTVMVGDNRWYGPFEGLLMRQAKGPHQSIAWSEHHYKSVDPPPESWLASHRGWFQTQQWTQWEAWVTIIPDWTATPYYTPDP